MGMSLREQGSRAARRADSVVRVDAGPRLTSCAPNPHLHCAPGRPSRRISAITMFRSSSFIFSSTTFSGIKSMAEPERGISWEVLQAGLGARCHPPRLLHPPSSAGARSTSSVGQGSLLLLTLVVDEAVCCQQLQGMDLEEHAVEEEAVGRRPLVGVEGQARQNELLRVKHKA